MVGAGHVHVAPLYLPMQDVEFCDISSHWQVSALRFDDIRPSFPSDLLFARQ